MNFQDYLTGKCFVLHQGYYNDVLRQKDKMILWPEQSLTLVELATGIKYEKSVITENPWIISCYDREDVFVFRDGRWTNPNNQTFGASVNSIMITVLLIHNTIPSGIISKESGEKLKEKIDALYK